MACIDAQVKRAMIHPATNKIVSFILWVKYSQHDLIELL
jgi:hypothetical protein